MIADIIDHEFLQLRHFINLLESNGLPEANINDNISNSFCNEIMSLGVILDFKLTWKPHIMMIKK